MSKLSLLKSRRFRHGTFSVFLVVFLIAAIVLLNVIASALYQKFRPNGDMTNNKLYTLTDASKELLSDMEAPVSIIFCAMPDELISNTAMRYVYYLALEYEKTFDNVKVECRDIYTNPTSMQKYMTSEATRITQQSVVIESGTEYRLFALPAFFVTAESDGRVFAFQGEKKMTSAMLQVTASDMPIAYFTNTHGEDVDAPEATSHSALWTTFEDAGFDVRLIDLSVEQIEEDARIIVINNPLYDFSGRAETGGEESEIQKIDDFLSGYGSLVVFRDPVVHSGLTNLDEFLAEWGIGLNQTTIRDKEHSIKMTLGGSVYSGYGIIAQYPEEGAGASIVADIRDLAASPKTLVPLASPITCLDLLDGRISISPILMTYPGASLEADGGTVETDGQYNLMTISTYSRIVDNETYNSYVLACASSYYASDRLLTSTSYANQDVLYAAVRAMGKEKVPADIDFKLISSEALDITESEQTQWTLLLIFTFPVILTVVGIIVFVRRKHS